jgi:predicted DNA-binding protein
MPEAEREEPLVKTSVALTADQVDRLQRRGKREDRSVSYYVRVAIDKTFPEPVADDERRTA